jgi:hypothetical protein
MSINTLTQNLKPRLFHVPSKIKKFAFSCSILIFGLVIIELVFGNWLNSNQLNQLNIIRNRELTYDIGDLYKADNHWITYRRDQYGLRGQYGGDPSKIDVLTLGGSTTDQRYITEGNTWQDVLQKDFVYNQKLLKFANAGVDGQTTYGHIRDFDWWFPSIPGLRAKYFLFYVGINDFYNEDDNSDLDDSTLKGQIKQKSALYYLYRTIKGLYRVKRAGLSHHAIDFSSLEWLNDAKISNHERVMHSSLQSYNERLRYLADKVRSMGGTSIFITQPSRRYKKLNGAILGSADTSYFGTYEINGVDYFIMMQLLNRETMRVCHETGGICIDLANELEFEDEDFYDYYHNTPRGAEKIGHYLYRKLKPLFS